MADAYDGLIFHLTVSVNPEDHEAIDFLRGLADDELTTRIETDGDNLTTVTVMHVTTYSFEDEHNARVLAEYMGIEDDREEPYVSQYNDGFPEVNIDGEEG